MWVPITLTMECLTVEYILLAIMTFNTVSSYLTNDCSEQQPSEAANACVLVTAGRNTLILIHRVEKIDVRTMYYQQSATCLGIKLSTSLAPGHAHCHTCIHTRTHTLTHTCTCTHTHQTHSHTHGHTLTHVRISETT